jgi:hypothetical protein
LLVSDYWLLVIGYWLLVIGYWLLVIGYWLFVIGYWLLVSYSPACGLGHLCLRAKCERSEPLIIARNRANSFTCEQRESVHPLAIAIQAAFFKAQVLS